MDAGQRLLGFEVRAACTRCGEGDGGHPSRCRPLIVSFLRRYERRAQIREFGTVNWQDRPERATHASVATAGSSAVGRSRSDAGERAERNAHNRAANDRRVRLELYLCTVRVTALQRACSGSRLCVDSFECT